MEPTRSQAAAATPPKSTLFCPACDYSSRYDGGWDRRETPRETRYRCPECRTRITARPKFPRDDPLVAPYRQWERTLETWKHGVRAWRKFWYRTTRLPLG